MNKQNLPQSLQDYQQGIADTMRIYHDFLAAHLWPIKQAGLTITLGSHTVGSGIRLKK